MDGVEATVVVYAALASSSHHMNQLMGPCVQYCPCEASAKMGQKPKSELKEIELSYCHHSICFKNKHSK